VPQVGQALDAHLRLSEIGARHVAMGAVPSRRCGGHSGARNDGTVASVDQLAVLERLHNVHAPIVGLLTQLQDSLKRGKAKG
jgi:hypothetical protein